MHRSEGILLLVGLSISTNRFKVDEVGEAETTPIYSKLIGEIAFFFNAVDLVLAIILGFAIVLTILRI